MSDDVVKGTAVSEERWAQYQSLVGFFDAKTSMDRIDGYAKWIFASSATVGALGVGLANGVVAKAQGVSALLFVAAIACLGVSLVAACWSIAPRAVKIKLNELESMRDVVNAQFRERERHIKTATAFYVAALLLAAMVPLLSTLLPPIGATLTYSVDAKGSITADATVRGVRRGDSLWLVVERQGVPLAGSAVSAGAAGDQTLHAGPVVDASGAASVVLRKKGPQDARWTDVQRLAIAR